MKDQIKLGSDESLVTLKTNPNYGTSHRKVGEEEYTFRVGEEVVVKTVHLKQLQDEKNPQYERHLEILKSGDSKSGK